jgi:hypothetical protein
MAFGVLIAPTAFGRDVLDLMGQLAQGITQSANP